MRVALLGYGLAGRVLHQPLLRGVTGLSLTHIVTADPARREQARRDVPGVEVVEHADELWRRAGEYDAVVVATPNDSHLPLATASLELGKATVVDKPLARTADEAALLVSRAAELAVPLTVFHNRRWDSDTLTAAALLAGGSIGRVHRLESRFTRFRPEVATRWRERAGPGGGVLLDLGSHLVDQALHLLGPAVEVYAEVDARRGGAAVDDDCFLALTHTSGARSHLWCSMIAPAPGPRLVLQGSHAGWVKDDLDGQEDALRAGVPAGLEPPGRLTDAGGTREIRSLAGDWPAFYRGFLAAVTGAADVPVPPGDGVSVLQVLDAARRSARHHQVVPLI